MKAKKFTVSDLELRYELRAQKIQDGLAESERWGRGAYDRHELALITEFLGYLHNVESDRRWTPTEWHPMDEHPKRDGRYLVTTKDEDGELQVKGIYYDMEWLIDFEMLKCVPIRWAEMPAPYEGD